MTAPPNDEGPTAAAATPQEQTQTDDAIIATDDAGRKEFETMRAKAAFARCTLFELASGGYLLCLAGVTRELPDLRAVAALLTQMGPRV